VQALLTQLADAAGAEAPAALRARITSLAAPADVRAGDDCERLMQRLAEA
jgi:hypothetical protein